jgi:SH3-like domain-containing protein
VFHKSVTPATAGASLPSLWLKKSGIPAFAGMTMLLLASSAAAQEKRPPYWASIASGQAMTRTGPGKNYPGIWLYQRRDLPIRVIKKYENWRLIQDPDGVQGWMLVTLLSDRRTAIVKKGAPASVHIKPKDAEKIHYLAEQGTVGRIDHCKTGWCHVEFGKREGYIRTSSVWGVGENEVVD